MKHITRLELLIATLCFLCGATAFAQFTPPPGGAFEYSGSSWVAAVSTSTTNPLSYTPPPVALYCLNGSNKWVPADSSCFGGGGPVFTYPAGTGVVAVTGGSAWGTTYNVSNLIPANFIGVGIPIANIGSAGLSGTSPISISTAGVISCSTCGTSSFSPSGTGIVRAASGSPGTTAELSGDATTSGSNAVTVVGLNGVHFCSGFTPTTGQAVTYTTASSPNPCYTATTASTPVVVGGIVGGYYGSAVLINNSPLAPWTSGYFSAANNTVIMPFSAAFRNLMVVTSNSQSASGVTNLSFAAYDGNNVFDYPVSSPFIQIQSGATAGVYTSNPAVPPWPFGAFMGVYVSARAINSGTLSTIRGYSWDIVGSNLQPLGFWEFGAAANFNPSSTHWIGPSEGDATITEAQVGMVVPYNSTASNFCIWTNSTNPADAGLVGALRTNGATTTALTFTVPISAPAGMYCDNTHTVSITAGQWIDWQFINSSTSVSAGYYSATMALAPSGSATAMIPFTMGCNITCTGLSFSSGTAQYATPFTITALSTTEANQRAPMPRAGVMKNLACLYTTPPGTNPIVATIMQNGSPSALTVTLPTTGSGTQIQTDSTHTVTFAAQDTFDLKFLQTSGSNPVISSCSVEFD